MHTHRSVYIELQNHISEGKQTYIQVYMIPIQADIWQHIHKPVYTKPHAPTHLTIPLPYPSTHTKTLNNTHPHIPNHTYTHTYAPTHPAIDTHTPTHSHTLITPMHLPTYRNTHMQPYIQSPILHVR